MLSIPNLWTFLGLLFLHQSSGNGSGNDENDLASHPGHLKPVGSVGSFFEVSVIDEYPSTKDFFNKFVVPSIPVLIKGAVRSSKAFNKWSDEYFLGHSGSSEIVFTEGRKKEIRTGPGEDVSFQNFVENYKTKDRYMVNDLPTFLRPDVEIPSPLKCNAVLNNFYDVMMWFSSGGTKSVVHFDSFDNMNCLYRGNKTLIFINYHDVDQDWINNIIDQPSGGYSDIDVDAVDYVKYHMLANTRYAVVNMTAGDCIFIPFHWFHQVNSQDNNLAVNIWFYHLPSVYIDLTEGECGVHNASLTLDKIVNLKNPNPSYNSRDITTEDHFLHEDNATSVPFFMKTITRNIKAKRFLTANDVQSIVNNHEQLNVLNESDFAVDVFNLLDVNEDKVLNRSDFKIILSEKKTLSPIVQNISSLITEKMIISHAKEQREQQKKLIQNLIGRGDIPQHVAKVIFRDDYFPNIFSARLKEEL